MRPTVLELDASLLQAALATRRPNEPHPEAPRPEQTVLLVACAPPQPAPRADAQGS